jgi:hypothetical protein
MSPAARHVSVLGAAIVRLACHGHPPPEDLLAAATAVTQGLRLDPAAALRDEYGMSSGSTDGARAFLWY